MDNIYNNLSNIYNKIKEGKLEIINIDNINDNYTVKINKYPYNLSINSIVLFKSPTNYIILTSTVKLNENQKNGIFTINLNIENRLNKPIEYFYDMKDLKLIV